MAFSPLRSKALHHNRSLSLPSKINPAKSRLDENLSNVKVFEYASSSSLSSMKTQVNSLRKLYSNINDLLLLPHIKQIISKEYQEKSVDQVLDGYIRLLDACTTAKDLISNTKQDVQELLSALRRKDAAGIRCYLNSRRKSKKNINKSLKDLRSFRSNHILASLEKDRETMDLVRKLNDTESVSIAVFESLMSYLAGRKLQARQSGWSLVAKLMHYRKVRNCGCEDKHSNEFEKMEAFLRMSVEEIQVENLMNLLKEIDFNIQNLEEELEFLFRQLIQTRVFLLNVLNH